MHLFIFQTKGEDEIWQSKEVKLSSAQYHHDSGFSSRNNLLKSWTTQDVLLSSPKSENFDQYIDDQLRIFARKQEEFIQRKVTRLKLKKFICVQRTCAKIAKQIIGDSKNVFIAIGTTKLPASSPIKGMIVWKKT